jgi:hypothetical protein
VLDQPGDLMPVDVVGDGLSQRPRDPQAAYDGHPLYTYVGDSAAGQANGNNLNLNGGLWREVPASG